MWRIFLAGIILVSSSVVNAEEKETKAVQIRWGVVGVEVKHNGKPVTIQRNQDRENEIVEFYRSTTRGRIQPMNPFAPHAVETIGELEMIDYLVQLSEGDHTIVVVDSRKPEWLDFSGMIPGAVNIPFTEFKSAESTGAVMQGYFNVSVGDTWDFSEAKTAVMYCNGNWCPQSPTAIKRLLKMGYPAAKIKYYRGGMQSWSSLGLTTVEP